MSEGGHLGKYFKRYRFMMINFMHQFAWVMDAQVRHCFWLLPLRCFQMRLALELVDSVRSRLFFPMWLAIIPCIKENKMKRKEESSHFSSLAEVGGTPYLFSTMNQDVKHGLVLRHGLNYTASFPGSSVYTEKITGILSLHK